MSIIHLLPRLFFLVCILFNNVAIIVGSKNGDKNSDKLETAESLASSISSLSSFYLRRNNKERDNIYRINDEESRVPYNTKEEALHEEDRQKTTKESSQRSLQRLVGYGGSPPAEAYPLQACEGDCDQDFDCDEGLVCLQRDDPTDLDVPGCLGRGNSRTDYCILGSRGEDGEVITGQPVPATSNPTATTTPNPTITPTEPPTDHPTQRPTTTQPTSSPTASPTSLPTNIPTSSPTQSPTMKPSVYPTTSPSTSFMPSVSFAPTTSLQPSESPSMMPTMEPFMLKLHWEEGYMWQESPTEKKWCMTYNYDGQPGTGKCWYREVTQPCNTHEIYVAKCQEADDPYIWQQQQFFRFEFIRNSNATSHDDEILIATAGDTEINSNKCLERIHRAIYLRPCDIYSQNQRWFAINGSFTGEKFEISQRYTRFYFDQCVTQAHHPKPGEVVELQPCQRARSPAHQTSYWNAWRFRG